MCVGCHEMMPFQAHAHALPMPIPCAIVMSCLVLYLLPHLKMLQKPTVMDFDGFNYMYIVIESLLQPWYENVTRACPVAVAGAVAGGGCLSTSHVHESR